DIYVGTAGRPFARMLQVGAGGTDIRRSGRAASGKGQFSQVAPGEASAANDRVSFEGRSLVIYRSFASGARRVAIDFDATGTNCTARVLHGRERGQNIVRRDTARGRAEVLSSEVGAVRCSVREGNVFGQ